MSIEKALNAKRNNTLNRLINTSAYGLLSRRERIERTLADGGSVECVEVTDEATRTRLEREYEAMNRGFNVPWGNECHPKTIAAQALRNKLAGRITKLEYRLHRPNGEYFNELSKTEYEYAKGFNHA